MRLIRISKGIDQKALAYKLNVTTSYVSKIENDRVKSPGKNVLESLASALNVSVSELLGEIPESTPTKRLVPCLDMVQAGGWTGINDHPYPGVADEYEETDLTAPRPICRTAPEEEHTVHP